MLDTPIVNRFSHVKPTDTAWSGQGLRDFCLYRDLGVAAATGGRVITHLVKANQAPEHGTGWHFHEADFHIVLMLKGLSGNNRIGWSDGPAYPRHGRRRPAIHDLLCRSRENRGWGASAHHDGVGRSCPKWSRYFRTNPKGLGEVHV